MAIYGTMIGLGMTCAPLIMGLVFIHTSLNATFLIASLMALIIPITGIMGKKELSTF